MRQYNLHSGDVVKSLQCDSRESTVREDVSGKHCLLFVPNPAFSLHNDKKCMLIASIGPEMRGIGGIADI